MVKFKQLNKNKNKNIYEIRVEINHIKDEKKDLDMNYWAMDR